MRGLRSVMRRAALLWVVLAALTAPAEARRFRIPIFHSGGSSYGASGSEEVIDRVRDLPDIPAFEKDGDYLDVGFLYKRALSRGQTTSEDRANGFYVLYHGDSYVRLTSEMRSLLVSRLGYDPIAGHDRTTSRPAASLAAAKPLASTEERVAAARAAAQWKGEAATSNIPGDPATRATKTRGGWPIMALLIGVLAIFAIRWQLKRAAKVIAPLFGTRGEDPDRPADAASPGFEARVAARLAELQTGSPVAAPAPTPAARTFGRKAA